MNPDVVKSTVTSVLASVLAMAGGYAVGKGWVTADQWASLSGAVVTLAGLVVVIAWKAAQHTEAKKDQ